MLKRSSLALALPLVFLVACSSNDDGDDMSGGGDGGGSIDPMNTTAIAGFWDDSVVEENNTEDVVFLNITGDGRLISRDYLGDSFDAIADCYESEVNVIRSLGDDQYLFFPATNPAFRIGAVVDGDVMTVSFGYGETDTLNRAVNGIPEYPECEGSPTDVTVLPTVIPDLVPDVSTIEATAIAGLWDASQDGETVYVDVVADGSINLLFEFGEGEAVCYDLTELVIANLGGDQYRVLGNSVEGAVYAPFTATVTDDILDLGLAPIFGSSTTMFPRATTPLDFSTIEICD